MRLDSLIRLIDAADFMAFRELALECLRMKGYQQVALTDGWSDGGTDVRVFELPPNPSGIAFQVTVIGRWKSKLHDDAGKVKSKLGLSHMTLVSSRRLAEAEFQAESDLIWKSLGVRVTKIDGPAIAATFFAEGRTGRVLEILGITEKAGVTRPAPSSPREEAAYAYAFFGREADEFRIATTEAAVVAVGARLVGAIDRQSFEESVCRLMQLPATQAVQVSSAIDRMIQRGDLHGKGGELSLSATLIDAGRSMLALRNADWADLREQVRRFIIERARLDRIDDLVLEAIMDDLGGLLIETAHGTHAALSGLGTQADLVERARARLRHLHSALDSIAVSEGADRDALLGGLAELASNSPVGRAVLAGELFLCLSSARLPHLVRALGAHSGVKVLLDASVAIPILAALLFRPVGGRFSESAYHAYSQLRAHDVRVVLPIDYLEECATHLLRAWRNYHDLIEVDPDLARSENAYVSHFATLRLEGWGASFSDYVRVFGLDEPLKKGDFFECLRVLKPRLQRLFDRYSIVVEPLGNPTPESFRRAQEGLAYAVHELRVTRPEVLMRHDLRTIAYLFDTERLASEALVLCSWDRIHFRIRERESTNWLVLNPATLGDVLTLADSGPEGAILSPRVLALSLSEEAASRGAKVWDAIARIERGSGFDGELLAQAKAFKEDYVARRQSGAPVRQIEKEWARWRAEHTTAGQ